MSLLSYLLERDGDAAFVDQLVLPQRERNLSASRRFKLKDLRGFDLILSIPALAEFIAHYFSGEVESLAA